MAGNGTNIRQCYCEWSEPKHNKLLVCKCSVTVRSVARPCTYYVLGTGLSSAESHPPSVHVT